MTFTLTTGTRKRGTPAVAGQTVNVEGNKIFVDGIQYHAPKAARTPAFQAYKRYSNHKIVLQVPSGFYFVVGDNIEKSVDSRRYGPIAEERIVGKVVRVIWPLNRIGFNESKDTQRM
jgi:signal peptidase I